MSSKTKSPPARMKTINAWHAAAPAPRMAPGPMIRSAPLKRLNAPIAPPAAATATSNAAKIAAGWTTRPAASVRASSGPAQSSAAIRLAGTIQRRTRLPRRSFSAPNAPRHTTKQTPRSRVSTARPSQVRERAAKSDHANVGGATHAAPALNDLLRTCGASELARFGRMRRNPRGGGKRRGVLECRRLDAQVAFAGCRA
jgi:hypothetical protein